MYSKVLVSHPFTLTLVGFLFPGMGRSYLKGSQTFSSFGIRLNIVTREKRNNSNHTKHHLAFVLENTQGVLLLPQANTHTFFLISERLCFGSAYCKQTQLLEKSIMLNRKKYWGSNGAVWWENVWNVYACKVVHSFMHLQ